MMVLVVEPEAIVCHAWPSREASSFSFRCLRSSAFMRQTPGAPLWGRDGDAASRLTGRSSVKRRVNDRTAGTAGQREWAGGTGWKSVDFDRPARPAVCLGPE